ncbi:hypothetical protein BDV93DRAFT_218141 [Ceratobasidium sp. AG-I]|nr:hypothetical protein BDV93DRAFT_218141 [Ceratobasidium sp. AG-I]
MPGPSSIVVCTSQHIVSQLAGLRDKAWRCLNLSRNMLRKCSSGLLAWIAQPHIRTGFFTSAACIGVLALMICDMHIGGLGSAGILTGYKTTAIQGVVQTTCIPPGSSLSGILPIAMIDNLKFLAGGLYLTGVGMAVLGSNCKA